MAGRPRRTLTKNPEFGAWLLGRMAAAGLSQRAFAAAIGASNSAVSRWVTGAVPPRGDFHERIAAVLGIDPAELLRRVESGPGYHSRPGDPEVEALVDAVRAMDLGRDGRLSTLRALVEHWAHEDRLRAKRGAAGVG
jgi:transcriptional regulator with XRE-family HTH domain